MYYITFVLALADSNKTYHLVAMTLWIGQQQLVLILVLLLVLVLLMSSVRLFVASLRDVFALITRQQ